MKYFFRILILLISLVAIYFLGAIIIASFSGYSPKDKEIISNIDEPFYLEDSVVYSALIWNIGYAGLGAEMDFFYDGGKDVRGTEESVHRNIYEITGFLQNNDTVDFMLLQEVDVKSKRSYKIDLVDHLNMSLPEHFPFFAANYKVNYVPVPVFDPMGGVHSGLLTLSKHIPQQTIRYSFPGNYSWPKSIFMLNRCFISNRFLMKNGKAFTLVNTHNSAYDDGSLRLEQMNFMKNYLVDLDSNNSSFLVGGDWNQCPSDFSFNFNGHVPDTINVSYINDEFLQDGWSFIYDGSIPTNRRLLTSYTKGETSVTLIDFFLKSKDIEVVSCKTVDLDFVNSDHQPVIISFRIK